MNKPLILGGIYRKELTKELYILGVSIKGGYTLINLLSGNRDNDDHEANYIRQIIDANFTYLGTLESINILPKEPQTVNYKI